MAEQQYYEAIVEVRRELDGMRQEQREFGQAIKQDQREFRQAMKDMANAVNRLAVLDAKHQETREATGRAFDQITLVSDRVTLVDGRVQDVEKELPTLRMASGFVFKTAVWCCAALGGFGLLAVAFMFQAQGAAG